MSDEDHVVSQRVEIPGMQITFGGPLSPDNKGLTFVLAADALIPELELNDRLDVVGRAFRRQAAIEELPIIKQSLYANRKLLATARAEKAAHEARMGGRVEQLGARRRGAVQATPQDVNALSQHDQRILQIQGQIEGAEARIPYLQALVDGEKPPELFPSANDTAMAAE